MSSTQLARQRGRPPLLRAPPAVTKEGQQLKLLMASSFFLATPIPLVERFHNQDSTVHCSMALLFSVCGGLREAVMLSPSVEVLVERTRVTTLRAILSTPTMGA